jgi:hypothetical protein
MLEMFAYQITFCILFILPPSASSSLALSFSLMNLCLFLCSHRTNRFYYGDKGI